MRHLLLEEIDDEEILLHHCEDNVDVHPMFKTRSEESCFHILVNRHLIKDDQKFREYFRLNISQFNYVLELVKEDIKTDGSQRYQYPITPEEKLAVTLRYVKK